ncbi:MAG: TlpA disulfide reductase family protein [Granulosicoccaceae bacterium]|jgi:thiol-disulfide isomerase/thioredoxin
MKYLAIILALLLPGPAMSEPTALPPGIIAINDKPAPAFTLSDMDGNVSVFAATSGQWKFVHFWASWCGPCRKEMPAIEKLVASMQDETLEFYIINTAEDEDTIFTFLAATAPELHTLMDRDGQVTEAWQPRGLPATYLVDPQGRLRYQALGGREWHKPAYTQFLLRLLAEQ